MSIIIIIIVVVVVVVVVVVSKVEKNWEKTKDKRTNLKTK